MTMKIRKGSGHEHFTTKRRIHVGWNGTCRGHWKQARDQTINGQAIQSSKSFPSAGNVGRGFDPAADACRNPAGTTSREANTCRVSGLASVERWPVAAGVPDRTSPVGLLKGIRYGMGIWIINTGRRSKNRYAADSKGKTSQLTPKGPTKK